MEPNKESNLAGDDSNVNFVNGEQSNENLSDGTETGTKNRFTSSSIRSFSREVSNSSTDGFALAEELKTFDSITQGNLNVWEQLLEGAESCALFKFDYPIPNLCDQLVGSYTKVQREVQLLLTDISVMVKKQQDSQLEINVLDEKSNLGKQKLDQLMKEKLVQSQEVSHMESALNSQIKYYRDKLRVDLVVENVSGNNFEINIIYKDAEKFPIKLKIHKNENEEFSVNKIICGDLLTKAQQEALKEMFIDFKNLQAVLCTLRHLVLKRVKRCKVK